MYLNREYSIGHFMNNKYSSDFLFVTADVKGKRVKKLLAEFPNARYAEINYLVDQDSSGALVDKFSVSTNFDDPLNGKEYFSLYQDLKDFVDELNRITKSIVIDISELHLRFLGAFFAMLSIKKWENIFAAYAEPKAYIRSLEKAPDLSLDKDPLVRIGGFDLNSSFWGYEEIPNLKTIASERDQYIWIAFLGFEGKRATAVYAEIADDSSMTIPVITMPAMQPGWATIAFDANQALFDNARINCQSVKYISALDPYAAYNLIEKIHEEHPRKHIVMSPLGTRPVSLGVLLYAMRHEESEVYFDTPKSACSEITSAGRVRIYDILSFYENLKE
uniref:hypothetical protein n=1 Tax=Acetatifactor sp. TaxID=1872090 RepID=UPI00405601EE